MQSDIKAAVETRQDIYPSAEDISTPEKMFSLLTRVFKNTTDEDVCW